MILVLCVVIFFNNKNIYYFFHPVLFIAAPNYSIALTVEMAMFKQAAIYLELISFQRD